ncbi:hypothetical protein EB796_023173 [Bugula neritina]|uniref:Uncharacterized protein n=1 Tax=Bugula neritina TaxID=10212 RepID=A0A7J7IZ45_BUGNE|nr:hypothetical protein EB796_023173 [Bugula neritina]
MVFCITGIYRALLTLNFILWSASSKSTESSTCLHANENITVSSLLNVTTKDDELEWPCELRQYQASLHVLVSLVECLLSYGTAAIV